MIAPRPETVEQVLEAIGFLKGPLRTWSKPLEPGSHLAHDAGLDDLDRFALAAEFEGERIDMIPDAEVAEWETVADVARSVERLAPNDFLTLTNPGDPDA